MARTTLDPTELGKWPLMHGTLQCGEGLEKIRTGGLVAGAAANSFDYDLELGRTAYVFIAPASFRFDYGFGSGILVDPAIVHKQGAHCSDQDIGNAVNCIKIWLDGDECCGLTRDRVKEIDSLRQIVNAHRTQHGAPVEGSGTLTAMQIIASPAFKAYYAEHYCISPDRLFRAIAYTAARDGYSLGGYFDRTGIWELTEEFLVPGHVEPDYLLGHWDGTNWTEWARPKSAESGNRLGRWLDRLAGRRES